MGAGYDEKGLVSFTLLFSSYLVTLTASLSAVRSFTRYAPYGLRPPLRGDECKEWTNEGT